MRAAVLGSPIAHSRSPALHHAAYRALGLHGWSYVAVEMRPEGLPEFLDGLGAEWAGLSLTMPLKRTAVALLDEIAPLAGRLGVVNTVTFASATPWSDPAVRTRRGDNTDVDGIDAALREAGVNEHDGDDARRAVVLGGGATAASAIAALAGLGVRCVDVVVRTPARADGLIEVSSSLGVVARPTAMEQVHSVLDGAELVVSTLPAGTPDPWAPAVQPAPGAVLLDAVYHPWPTALAAAWQAHGGRVVPGARMLLHQAVRQVELMTGRRPDPADLEAALD